MTKEQDFLIYLLEYYAAYKNRPTGDILTELDELDLTDFICSMYELYHCEAIQNAFEDIDALIAEKERMLERI